MAQTVYSQILKKFRDSEGLTQLALANILGVKQGTVSRIEKGTLVPSDDLAEKIRKLPISKVAKFSPPLEQRKKIKPEYCILSLGEITVASATFYEERSGDFCSIDKLSKNKIGFMLADTVGHGINSSRMSFALEFGYKVLLTLFESRMLTATLFETAMRGAIDKTKADWLGPPSIISGTINTDVGVVEFINSGQPSPLAFAKTEVRQIGQGPIRPAVPLQAESLVSGAGSTIIHELAKGDAVLMYTDGFSELMAGFGENIKTKFSKTAKFLKGDAEAIIKNMTLFGESSEIDSNKLPDDSTILVITRARG